MPGPEGNEELQEAWDKRSYQKKFHTLDERSDQDRHESFDPEALGMEDWGDGFYVNPEQVLIERGPDGAILRTTPLSETTPEMLQPKVWKDGELITAPPIPTPSPTRGKDQVVHMLAGLLLKYYSKLPPGAVGYNPLYDGIPAKEFLGDDWIFQPEKKNAELVHVTPAEVHEWLRKVIGKRAEIRNAKTGFRGVKGDISDLVVNLKR